jgi:hypothetical protein
MYDILLERTGSQLYDKRRNAGAGMGFEFWRILKRDFGTSSTDAQLAKLQLYTKPRRCSTMAELCPALDRWEALGRELGRPVDDDFRLLALRELVPKAVADMMTAQVSLRSFPEAIMFVRRQAAEHRHLGQVQEVQRQGAKGGHAPMDLSAALVAAVAQLRTGESNGDEPAEEDLDPLETLIAALKGQGKGKSGETRECYNCGKKGHLSRDCFQKKNTEDSGAKGKGKSKGKGKGKGKGVHALEVDDDGGDESINIRCLTRACESMTLAACERGAELEQWEGFECVEVVMDSGAGDCVCGPQHFMGVDLLSGDDRPNAGVEYICADGGRISNVGEKAVRSVTDNGVPLNVTFQVTAVDRPLLAVSKLTEAGHQVWFGKDLGTITHGRTGKVTSFKKRNGVYVLDMWVRRATSGGSRR